MCKFQRKLVHHSVINNKNITGGKICMIFGLVPHVRLTKYELYIIINTHYCMKYTDSTMKYEFVC